MERRSGFVPYLIILDNNLLILENNVLPLRNYLLILIIYLLILRNPMNVYQY